MNPDSKITKVLKPSLKSTPSALASDLAKAQDALAAAQAKYLLDRNAVVEKGVKRGSELNALKQEIEAEEAAVAAVVAQASAQETVTTKVV